MQGVPRRPDGLEGHHAVDQFLGIGAEVTAGEFGLALGHASDHLGRLFLEFFIAAALVGQRATGKVVAHGMAAQFALGFLPAAVWLGGCRQAGGQPERVEQPVGFEAQEVFLVEFLRMFERAVQQFDVGQAEWPDLDGALSETSAACSV